MASSSVFGLAPTRGGIVNYRPHAGQDEISDALEADFWSKDTASIIEIIASRGWGKTLYFVCSILMPYLANHPNAKVMWVAPTYQICMSPVDDVFKGTDETTGERYIPQFDPENGAKIWDFATTKSGPMLTYFNGATVTFRSADSPDSIVSKGFNLIIIDEACLIEEQVFTQQILGTARKAGIKIFMISSPRGKKHWTYKYFLKGQDPNDPNYLSFRQPYTKNPHFSPILAKLIKDIPEWLFRQEYMAEFIEDGDSVFRGLDNIFFGPEVTYQSNQQLYEITIKDDVTPGPDGKPMLRSAEDRRFIVAMDLAKSVDYTVLIGMDLDTGEVVYYRRLNKTDYREVLNLAVQVCKRLNQADLIFDATGVGQGLADMLNNYDVTAHPYVFTNESKNDLVNKLAISIEYAELKLPNIPTIRNELSVYTYTLTRTGKISYNAPAGFHDDIVVSLAMANWYRKENNVGSEISVVEDIIAHNSAGGIRRRSILDEMDEDDD